MGVLLRASKHSPVECTSKSRHYRKGSANPQFPSNLRSGLSFRAPCGNLSSASGLILAHSCGDGATSAINDIAHLPRKTIGFVDPANLWITKARPEQPGQLTVTINSFVVHFDDK